MPIRGIHDTETKTDIINNKGVTECMSFNLGFSFFKYNINPQVISSQCLIIQLRNATFSKLCMALELIR